MRLFVDYVEALFCEALELYLIYNYFLYYLIFNFVKHFPMGSIWNGNKQGIFPNFVKFIPILISQNAEQQTFNMDINWILDIFVTNWNVD